MIMSDIGKGKKIQPRNDSGKPKQVVGRVGGILNRWSERALLRS